MVAPRLERVPEPVAVRFLQPPPQPEPPEQPVEPTQGRDAGCARGRRRGDRWRRRDVVVVAAVLVVGPNEQRVTPARPLHHGVDHRCGERFAGGDVLRVLFGELAEVGIDDGERWQGSVLGVLAERLERTEMVPRTPPTQGIQVRR